MLTISVENGKKNIEIKIFKTVLHICGSQRMEQSTEAVELFFEILEFLQEKLNWIYENKNKYMRYVDRIEKMTKGDLYKNEKGNEYHKIKYYETDEINEIVSKKKFPSDIFKLLISYSYDYESHEDYINFLKLIVDMGNIYEGDLKIHMLKVLMVNYNYKINNTVNIKKLTEVVKKYPEFNIYHNDMIHFHTKIMLPLAFQEDEIIHESEIDEDDKCKFANYMQEYHLDDKKRKKYKASKNENIFRHSFLFYRSGKITQSSPDLDDAIKGYEKFRKLISTIEDEIKTS